MRGRPIQRAESVCLYRRRYRGLCQGSRRQCLPCGRGQGHGGLGQGERQALRAGGSRPSAGSSTTARKFVEREIKRGRKYDAIIMDPPSYGRGPNGEVWKLEEDLYGFVKLCAGCSVRQSTVRHHQFLHHRPGPLSAGISFRHVLFPQKYGGHTDCGELGLPVTDIGIGAALRRNGSLASGGLSHWKLPFEVTGCVHFSTTKPRSGSAHPWCSSSLDLTIEQGTFVVILGHNGCGKSTLAKHFNAILLPNLGEVMVYGMDTRG